MALSRFLVHMLKAADYINAADAAAVAIRDGSGDLRLADVNNLLQMLTAGLRTLGDARAEGTANTTAASACLPIIGGPTTLAQLATQITAIETRATQFRSALAAWLPTVPATGLVSFNGESFTRGDTIPAAQADVLRQSSQLENLITALEAVGP